MTVRECLRGAEERLRARGVPDAGFDASWLLGSVLRRSRLETLAMGAEPLPEEQLAAFERLLARRMRREPLQYILGETEFMGRRFLSRPGALIARNDTELLASLALACLRRGGRALDLCTGSGVLAVTLSLDIPSARVDAADISEEALSLARENARLHRADVNFLRGDLFAPCEGRRYDMICCNPPYIETAALDGLQEELRFEPRLALDGGEDGLDFYRRIAREAPGYLCPGGRLLLEFGEGQAEAIAGLLVPCFDEISVHKDLAGLPRALQARRKEAHALA